MDRIRKEVLHATKLRSLTFRPKALRCAPALPPPLPRAPSPPVSGGGQHRRGHAAADPPPPRTVRLLVDFLGDQQREGFDVNTDFSVFLAAATKNREPRAALRWCRRALNEVPQEGGSGVVVSAPCVSL